MERFANLIIHNEAWLIQRINQYINMSGDEERALKPAAGLPPVNQVTKLLLEDLQKHHNSEGQKIFCLTLPGEIPPCLAEDSFRLILQSTNLEECLKVIKYYRQSYLELLLASDLDRAEMPSFIFHIISFFDRIESICLKQLAGEAFSLQKAYFQQLFESSPEGIVMLDNEDRIMNVNKGFEKLFGYTLEQVKGHNINDIVVPETLYEEAQANSTRALNGESIHVESVRKRRDGSLIHVSILAYPIIVNNKQVGIYGIYSDISVRKEAEAKLHYLSLHDPLTGLYNRTYFEKQMKYYQNEWPIQIGIIVCDVDNLKMVNDTLGHDQGDILLVKSSKVIGSCLRKGDILTRIGGDEFAIFLPGIDAAGVTKTIANIRDSIAEYNSGENSFPSLSISIGGAVTDKMFHSTIHDLFREADNNMYKDKLQRNHGRCDTIIQTLVKALQKRDFFKKHSGNPPV